MPRIRHPLPSAAHHRRDTRRLAARQLAARVLRLALAGGPIVLWGCGAGSPADPSPSHTAGPAGPPVSAALGRPVVLRIGQAARVGSEPLTLVFRAVPEDSRCPDGPDELRCVWEGNATVRVELVAPSHPPRTLDLNTTIEPRRGSYLGYDVRLLSLAPPTTAGTPIAPERYLAELLVTRP